jgi:hypothetical protein
MALRQTKKISELPSLSPASLDTTFVVGISGSTTYKISINQLTSSLDTAFATDLVTNALSNTLDTKLSTSSFNSYTQSFTASVASGTISGSSQLTSSFDTRYTLSGSIPNIPTGSFATTGSNTFNGDMTLISSSNIILKGPALEYGGDGISGSGDIIWQDLYGNEMARLWKAADRDILTVSFTGSHNSYVYGTLIHSLNLKEFGDDHFTTTASFNSYTASQSTSSLVDRLNVIESVSGSWITESETGSFLTSLNGAISSSAQVIGILSSLNSVSASLISKTGSYATTGSNTFYGDQIFEGNSFTNLNIGDTFGGGTVFYVTPTLTLIAQTSDLGGAYGRGSARPTGSALGDGLSNTNQAINQYPAETSTAFYVASTNTSNGYTDWYLPSTLELITLIGQIGGLGGGWYITSTGDREVRGSDGLEVGNATNNGSVRLIRQIYTNEKPADNNNTNISITGSLSVSGNITGSTNFNTIVNKPTLISGSSQLTSSYDNRYTLSGSVVSGTTPAGTISGSSQLTSSFDGRYVQTGSFNTLTASFNSFTASAQSVTTGSNSFNGTQTITGSLIITTGSFVASQITANTSSLYLTSGSNLYVQNNGIVEITGSTTFSGSVNIISTTALQIGTGSGDEGGEILLAKSQTNNSLTGSGITIDSFQNKLRIFEQGGNSRGVYIDLIKAPNGVGGELLWKASGLVNAGVDVTLGNLKARLANSGYYSLQLSTVSGTYSVYGSSVYSYNGIGGITLSSPLTITTTPTYISAGYNFLVAGSTDTWIITDTSAGISWRISLMIGPSFTNNMISIERLV